MKGETIGWMRKIRRILFSAATVHLSVPQFLGPLTCGTCWYGGGMRIVVGNSGV